MYQLSTPYKSLEITVLTNYLKNMARLFFKSLYLSLFHISRQNIMSIGTQTSQKPENRNLLHLPVRSEQAQDYN